MTQSIQKIKLVKDGALNERRRTLVRMNFLSTLVLWIELLGVRTPVKSQRDSAGKSCIRVVRKHHCKQSNNCNLQRTAD